MGLSGKLMVVTLRFPLRSGGYHGSKKAEEQKKNLLIDLAKTTKN
jgi:hypothetical protein